MRTSYPDADPRLACFSKKEYSTERAAKRAATRVNNSPDADHRVVPYACTFCGKWHIGRDPEG